MKMNDNDKLIICEYCGQKIIEFGMHRCYNLKHLTENLENINNIIDMLKKDKQKVITLDNLNFNIDYEYVLLYAQNIKITCEALIKEAYKEKKNEKED
jgi:hypothetical protein